MEIYQDFKEWLELLNANQVDYVLAGAHALAFYGSPRYTGDLDVVIKPEPENARRILHALKKFGFESLNLSVQDLIQPESVIQLGFPPVRIDMITTLTGLNWQQIESGKVKGKFGTVEVFYLGKKEFIENKKALGRKKDLADIEAIERVDKTSQK
jgi:hypothetical protein